MSTAEIEAAPTVSDYSHPNWCDLLKCSPNASFHRTTSGLHFSAGTRWGLQGDEVNFQVDLVRSDDYLDNRNHASTDLRIILQNPRSDSDDPEAAGHYADAWISSVDARVLATILTRYADLADKDNRIWGGDCTHSDLPASDVPRLRAT